MCPRSPGPSSTVRGRPVSITGSPGRTPEVSSYTWMTVLSPAILMTSPMSCSVPTNTTSYIRGWSPVAVTTGPATRKISPVPFAFVSVFTLVAIVATSLEQINANGPSDLGAQVLRFLRAHRDDDRPGDRLETAPHRVAQLRVVARLEDEDAHLGVLEHRGDLPLEVLHRRRGGLPHPDELEPLHEVVPAHGGEFHLTPPGDSG